MLKREGHALSCEGAMVLHVGLARGDFQVLRNLVRSSERQKLLDFGLN